MNPGSPPRIRGWCLTHDRPECWWCGGDPWPDHCAVGYGKCVMVAETEREVTK